MPNVYQTHGYADRSEYLESIAADYNMDQETVYALADLLGPNEDFDGLISSLEDYQEGF